MINVFLPETHATYHEPQMQGRMQKNAEKQPESTLILHSFILSYTLSYTRNSLYLLEVLATGVGNVGDFQKLFLAHFRGNVADNLHADWPL